MGALSRYYAAFEDGGPLKTERGGGGEGSVSLDVAATIREKYLALDMNSSSKEQLIEFVIQSSRRIITSDFDIYHHRDHLFYVKADCRPARLEVPFFLYWVPVDERDLPEFWRQKGFELWKFSYAWPGFKVGKHGCAMKVRFPFPVRYIRTGQYVPDVVTLWEEEAWLAPHGGREERPEFPAITGTRIIRADFDVYLKGRKLVYYKADCGPGDREPPFFLQVTPTDPTVLPRDRVRYGVDRLEFNTCTTERRLPAYAIRHIRTGQYTNEGRLWEVEFTFDQASGGERAGGSPRLVRSVFDVTLDGRRLIYRKAACRLADREARFFVHVTPVADTDLPPERTRYGFENLDFRHRSGVRVDEFGCTIAKRLPAYAIRRIRTGQFLPGKGPLWEGEWAMAQAALEQD